MKYLSAILALASVTFLTVRAEGNNEIAKTACQGFPRNGAVVCLSDISFAKCNDESFGYIILVDEGYHCEQGIVGRKLDVVAVGPPTTTRAFNLHTYGATA
ncbi:hypothetical protein PMZ80_010371 [Knufia obscura]|uniref:Uncharacterized protein n=2 Tax=Knufia TaxID=430999 RepID=A0AAN8EHU6_9EURO|nr:hypothetical protein PMZ80_010371 [Knufia obscura]KAK5951878.1 hypothetical protein OHC33_007171 [Knufia fluminis]